MPPIYIENLSIFSIYRYLIFVIFSFIFFFMYIVIRFNTRLQPFFSNLLSYVPSLKEEIRLLLYKYNDFWLGNLCVNIIDLLFDKKIFRYFFFAFRFFLYSILKAMRLYFFMGFVFFHQDLRILLYLAPVFFIAWLLNFLFYIIIGL